jgi:hypothetical protein
MKQTHAGVHVKVAIVIKLLLFLQIAYVVRSWNAVRGLQLWNIILSAVRRFSPYVDIIAVVAMQRDKRRTTVQLDAVSGRVVLKGVNLTTLSSQYSMIQLKNAHTCGVVELKPTVVSCVISPGYRMKRYRMVTGWTGRLQM